MNHINSLGSFQQHENVDKSELEKLREDLKNEREARLSLEDECDLLAKANIDLQVRFVEYLTF
jgi:hypothetical protein